MTILDLVHCQPRTVLWRLAERAISGTNYPVEMGKNGAPPTLMGLVFTIFLVGCSNGDSAAGDSTTGADDVHDTVNVKSTTTPGSVSASRSTTLATTEPTTTTADLTDDESEATTTSASEADATGTGPRGEWVATEPPPAGVRAQLRYVVGGGPLKCPPTGIEVPDPPYIVDALERLKVEVGSTILGCIAGFPFGRAVDVSVREPTGGEVRWTEPAVDEHTLIHRYLPAGSPLGDYEMVVSSGDNRATMAVTVVEASTERISADLGAYSSVWSERGSVTLSLAGFPRDGIVPMYLYGFRYGEQWPESGGDERVFIAELEPADLDARGEALYKISIPTDAPAGGYCLVTPSMLERIPELESGDPCWDGGGFAIVLD